MDVPGRESSAEQARIADLMGIIRTRGQRALDAGTRDAYLAKRLVDRFDEIVALDLEQPEVEHDRITPVAGNITRLDFPDNSFDLVLCSEVLEHLSGDVLPAACRELARVCSEQLVIGVPFHQDLRHARTTCAACGRENPAWAHVSSFDFARLQQLFAGLRIEKVSYVGSHHARTNWLTAELFSRAGNPYGPYYQQEPCIHCNAPLRGPAPRNLAQRLMSKLAMLTQQTQNLCTAPQAKWLHIDFRK